MAPASGPVSGAGTADTHQLYGSTASVFRWRPAATGFAAPAIATVSWGATRCDRLRRSCDRHCVVGGDPLRPASPLLRSPLCRGGRPAATGFAALAIATRLLTHDCPPGRDRDARRR